MGVAIKKKKQIFKVRLFGNLPCSAEMNVEAEDEEAAKDWAFENWAKFPWDGPDYETPGGSDVSDAEIIE